jgi:hypothetical protein
MSRAGNAWGIPFTLAKAVTLEAGGRLLEIAYRLEGLPPDFRQHFAVEFNFAGMPARADGRFFYVHDDPRGPGALAGIWTFPIQSVSQSEGGFELVHQSVVVMPHWIVTPDAAGTWRVALRLSVRAPQGGQVDPGMRFRSVFVRKRHRGHRQAEKAAQLVPAPARLPVDCEK